jgi:hypothetical protein
MVGALSCAPASWIRDGGEAAEAAACLSDFCTDVFGGYSSCYISQHGTQQYTDTWTLSKRCGLHVFPSRSRLPIRLKVWEGTLLADPTEAGKKLFCAGGLHGRMQLGARGENNGQHSGTPSGRWHATTMAKLIGSRAWQGFLRARVWGGCIAILKGGKVKGMYFMGLKVACDEELCFSIFGSEKYMTRADLWTPFNTR